MAEHIAPPTLVRSPLRVQLANSEGRAQIAIMAALVARSPCERPVLLRTIRRLSAGEVFPLNAPTPVGRFTADRGVRGKFVR
jgi:hypothetical protein